MATMKRRVASKSFLHQPAVDGDEMGSEVEYQGLWKKEINS
jgi:hypothetical protein